MDFRLLGPVEAYRSGHRIELGRRQERLLLGLLLLEAGRPVPTERLISLLWTNDQPAGPRAAVHTYVARLRARLAPLGLPLVNTSAGYRIDVHPFAVDVHRFRDKLAYASGLTEVTARVRVLRKALTLWRGPLLDDVASDDLRQRLGVGLDEQYLAAAEALAEGELATGQTQAALTRLVDLAARYPTRERFTALLMTALARAGRRAEALQAYQEARARMVDELGLEPGPELRALQADLLAEGSLDLDQDDERRATVAALARWYRRRAEAAIRALRPGTDLGFNEPGFSGGPAGAAAWLRSERPNLLALATLADRHGLDEAERITAALCHHALSTVDCDWWPTVSG